MVSLVQRARRGDREAFGELVDRYRDMVYGFAYHLTSDFEDARDLTQEAFVRAYVRLAQLREPARFPGWLRQIVTNLRRSEARRPVVQTLPLEDADEVAVKPSGVKEVELTVRQALLSLRECDRLVLTLHYVDGYTQPEIGQFLDTPPEVVKTRLARARARLRKELVEMVDETLSKRRLPDTFRQGVIAGVEGLVRDLRQALPPDLAELRSSVGSRRNALWREILDGLPEARRQAVQEGQPQSLSVSELPDDVRQRVREAMHFTWVSDILDVFQPPPWVDDLGVLWIRFGGGRNGETPTVSLANVPGNCGHIYEGISLAPLTERTLQPPAVLPTSPAQRRDVAQLLASLSHDAVEASECVRATLLEALPADAGGLMSQVHTEMCALFGLVREGLTPAQMTQREQGKRVAAAELDGEVKSALYQAVTLHWAERILYDLARAPLWVQYFETAGVEFGLYPMDDGLGEHAGREYVRVYAPNPHRPNATQSWQTGIWE
jgi:RNA polymerase sigma-70 factor (ECF subfamily)